MKNWQKCHSQLSPPEQNGAPERENTMAWEQRARPFVLTFSNSNKVFFGDRFGSSIASLKIAPFQMASSSSGSREEHDAFSTKSKEITRELKRLKTIAQKTNKRRRYRGFTNFEQDFACRLYVVAAHQPHVAVMYIRAKTKQQNIRFFWFIWRCRLEDFGAAVV